MTQRIRCADGAVRERAVAAALAAVRRGDLVIVPTESVYALATDAFSSRGIAALRDVKDYDGSVPIPVMVGSRSTVPGIAARIGDDALALMEAFWPGPLTLLLRPQPTLAWDRPAEAPLAVRMPLHPVLLALLGRSGPLAVTAANLRGRPAPTTVDDAVAQSGEAASLALDAGDLGPDPGLASTIVDVTGPVARIVRPGALSEEQLRHALPRIAGDEPVTGA